MGTYIVSAGTVCFSSNIAMHLNTIYTFIKHDNEWGCSSIIFISLSPSRRPTTKSDISDWTSASSVSWSWSEMIEKAGEDYYTASVWMSAIMKSTPSIYVLTAGNETTRYVVYAKLDSGIFVIGYARGTGSQWRRSLMESWLSVWNMASQLPVGNVSNEVQTIKMSGGKVRYTKSKDFIWDRTIAEHHTHGDTSAQTDRSDRTWTPRL